MALAPLDVSTPAADTASPTGDGSSASAACQRELRITIADEFLAEAAKEYQEGHVDPALWARASAQSGKDESLVTAAYLRARSTALQLQKQGERAERRARRANTIQGANQRKVEPEPQSEIPSPEAAAQLGGASPGLKYVAYAAMALASVIAVAWMIGTSRESDAVRQPSVSAAAPGSQRPLPAASVGSAQPVARSASDGASQGGSEPTLEATVRQLEAAGNWNVLVLHASKWTREQPENPAAWSALGTGYANLRQIDDALVAAARAAQLAPGDPRLWRNLGQLNLTLGNLPEAGNAFDRALAVSADDAAALCGAALVAQRQGRPKDADAMARRLRPDAGICPGVSDGETVTVDAGSHAKRKPVPSAGR